MSHVHNFEVVSAVYEPEPVPAHVLSDDEMEPRLRGVLIYRCRCGATDRRLVRGVAPADALDGRPPRAVRSRT